MAVPYPLFPIVAFLGFLLPLIPLPWHLQSWNSGTCYFMIWTSIASLNLFINSIVWHGNAINVAPWWCEISIRIMFGASVGIPAASLCINRRLYKIASVRSASSDIHDKRKVILIDTLICVLFPMIFIAIQYVVQGHRFNIFEDIGCAAALYNTLPLYFLNFMWPLIIGIITATFCGMTLMSFARRRLEFSQFMSTNKSLTMSRYLRLMALSLTELTLTIPLSIFMLWVNATAMPIEKWTSLSDTHFGWDRVEQIPRLYYDQNNLLVVSLEFTRWMPPISGLIFFAYFGFADEAMRHYKLAFWAVARRFGVYPPATPPYKAPKYTPPPYSLKMPSALEKGESVSMTPLPSPPPAYGASKATLTSTSSFSSTAPLALHFSYTLPSSPSLPAIPRVSRDSYQPGTAREVISVSEYSHADLSSAGFYPCPESPSSSSPFGLSTPMTATSSMPFTPTTPSSFDFPTTPSSMGASEWGSERTRVERDSTSTTDYVGPRVL